MNTEQLLLNSSYEFVGIIFLAFDFSKTNESRTENVKFKFGLQTVCRPSYVFLVFGAAFVRRGLSRHP